MRGTKPHPAAAHRHEWLREEGHLCITRIHVALRATVIQSRAQRRHPKRPDEGQLVRDRGSVRTDTGSQLVRVVTTSVGGRGLSLRSYQQRVAARPSNANFRRSFPAFNCFSFLSIVALHFRTTLTFLPLLFSLAFSRKPLLPFYPIRRPLPRDSSFARNGVQTNRLAGTQTGSRLDFAL